MFSICRFSDSICTVVYKNTRSQVSSTFSARGNFREHSKLCSGMHDQYQKFRYLGHFIYLTLEWMSFTLAFRWKLGGCLFRKREDTWISRLHQLRQATIAATWRHRIGARNNRDVRCVFLLDTASIRRAVESCFNEETDPSFWNNVELSNIASLRTLTQNHT